MEFNFSMPRVLLFAVLVGAFAYWGGFTPVEPAPDSMLDPRC